MSARTPPPLEPVVCPREREALAATCERWVKTFASRHARALFNGPQYSQARADFESAGWEGVAIALNKFDKARISPRTGRPVKFLTYAAAWVVQRIQLRRAELLRERHRFGPAKSLDTGFGEDGDSPAAAGLMVL